MVVKIPPQREDYTYNANYDAAVRRYRTYKRAQYVWAQIEYDERVWILKHLGFEYPELVVEADKMHDLSNVRLNQEQLYTIASYPRSEHRRKVFKERNKGRPHARDPLLLAGGYYEEDIDHYGEPPGTSYALPFEYDARYYKVSDVPMRRVRVRSHRRRA